MLAATKGGAIYIAGDDVANSNLVGIIQSSFSDNNAQSGGAIYAGPGARGQIAHSSFTANTAKSYGGALLADDDSQVLITDTTFAKNGNYSCFDPPLVGLLRDFEFTRQCLGHFVVIHALCKSCTA